MLENSILNEKLIKKIILDNYGLNINEVKHLDRGSANIYILDNKYVLKEFNQDREVDKILKEYNVISHLAKKGLRVPEYILTKDNKCYVMYEKHIIILQLFLEGYTIENNTGENYHINESAIVLGRLSKALEDFEPINKEYKFDTKEDLEESIGKLKKLIDEINNDNPYKERFINVLNKKIEICEKLMEFDFSELKKVTLKVCHGDYSVQQLIYNEKLGTAVIDFEIIKYMPIDWEIIRSYSYVDKCVDGKFNLDTFLNYVKTIKEYINLTKEDLKYMPYIYILQLVGSTFGYKQYNNDYTKTGLLNFALFRTNLCTYLYNNLDVISNRLLELDK